MFAQHNGQVCFLSLCAKTTIVQGYPLPKELVVMNGWVGGSSERPTAEIPAIRLSHIQYASRNAIRNRSQRQILGHNHIEWQIIEVSLAIDLWDLRRAVSQRAGTTRRCQTRFRAHEQAKCWWAACSSGWNHHKPHVLTSPTKLMLPGHLENNYLDCFHWIG